jgi:formiminotetrahydrofolate cyclodeaminase
VNDLAGWLDELAAPRPTPGAGGACAATVATAAALLAMATGSSDRCEPRSVAEAERLRRRALELGEEDAAAYREVLATRPDAGSEEGAEAHARAWDHASEVPLRICEAAAATGELGVAVLPQVAGPLRGEVLTALELAAGAARAAARLVHIDTRVGGTDPSRPATAERAVARLDELRQADTDERPLRGTG